MEDDDYWQNIGAGAEQAGGTIAGAVETERCCEGLPLIRKIGQAVLPQEVLPDDFFATQNRIYAVLDAGCLADLPVLLAAESLSFMNLFSGELAEIASDASPYLVELTKESDLLRGLLTTSGDGTVKAGAFWGAQAGIFLQTTLSLTQLRSHLRRFLRVLDGEDRAYFFRFWEPGCAEAYFRGLGDRPRTAARWFSPHDMDGQLDAIWFPVRDTAGDEYLARCRPTADLGQVTPERGHFRLAPADLEIFSHLQWHRDVALVASKLRQTPFDKTLPEQAQLIALCDATMRRMIGYGFTQLDMLYLLCVWDIQYGPQFEQQEDAHSLRQILHADRPAEWRFAYIKEEMIAREAAASGAPHFA